MNLETQSFSEAISALRLLMKKAPAVRTEMWQGQDVRNNPAAETRELRHVTVRTPLNGVEDLAHYVADIRPNLPWADEHFLERVGGEPLNPPPSWRRWPWALSADKHRTEGAGVKFNHTYPERYWPKYAGDESDGLHMPRTERVPLSGIREEYGDLSDLVNQLIREPHTRQAYLPVYFPEDTGHEGRKPCTLGYQFFVRDGHMDLYYPMRSCDLVRHYQDDIYLTVRLLLWVINQCRLRTAITAPTLDPLKFWTAVKPGQLIMHMTSLHVFVNDLRTL